MTPSPAPPGMPRVRSLDEACRLAIDTKAIVASDRCGGMGGETEEARSDVGRALLGFGLEEAMASMSYVKQFFRICLVFFFSFFPGAKTQDGVDNNRSREGIGAGRIQSGERKQRSSIGYSLRIFYQKRVGSLETIR